MFCPSNSKKPQHFLENSEVKKKWFISLNVDFAASPLIKKKFIQWRVGANSATLVAGAFLASLPVPSQP